MTATRTFTSDILELFHPMPRPRDAVTQGIFRQQQALLVDRCFVMGVVNIVNTFLVAFVFWNSSTLARIAVWGLPTLVFGVLQIHIWFVKSRTTMPETVSGRMLNRAEWTGLVMGLCWGSGVLLLPANGQGSDVTFLLITAAGMTAGVASLLTTLPRLVIRYSVGCMSLILIGLAVHRPEHALTLSCLIAIHSLAITIGNVMSLRRLGESLRARQAAEAARGDLMDAISSTQDAFVLLDRDNRVLIANARHRRWFGESEYYAPPMGCDPYLISNGRWVIANTRDTQKGDRVCVHTDITALKHRERELIDARQEAELADEAKSRFLNTMSHELRTPLNIILGFSRLMTRDSEIDLEPEQVAGYAQRIHSSADHLLCLINDIIDYSQMGLDGFDIESEPIAIREVLDRSVEVVKAMTTGAETAEFLFKVSPQCETLLIDEVVVRRILQNLLSNAVKFRATDPRIVVRVDLAGGNRPFITVRDFGIGMSPTEIDHAFDAFYQGHSGLGRSLDGTGLGLTLAKHLANLHGGEIILKSRQGSGTSATLLLPTSSLILDDPCVTTAPETTDEAGRLSA